MDNKFNETLWVTINKTVIGKTVALCLVYNPPEGSQYEDIEVLHLIVQTIAELRSTDENISICTASLVDFINDVDNDFSIDDNFENYMLNVENVALDDNILKQRVSKDTASNKHGLRLIQLCKVLSLYSKRALW